MKDIRVGANIWGLLNRERGSGLHHVEIRSAGPDGKISPIHVADPVGQFFINIKRIEELV